MVQMRHGCMRCSRHPRIGIEQKRLAQPVAVEPVKRGDIRIDQERQQKRGNERLVYAGERLIQLGVKR